MSEWSCVAVAVSDLPADGAAITPGPTETARLAERARQGDAAAFEALMALHEQTVLRTAHRLLGRLEDARDAAQEVFLRVYRYLHSYDPSKDLLPWIYRITVNVSRDMRRRRTRREAIELTARAEEFPDPPVTPTHELSIDLETEKRILLAGLKRLSDKERSVIVLHDIEERPSHEIATVLGCAQATVRSRLFRARAKLARHRMAALRGKS